MPKPKPLPDAAFLRECFSYDPDTGDLTWRVRPLAHFVKVSRHKAINTEFAGKAAGKFEGKSVRVKIAGRKVLVSRIIWKMVTGEEPGDMLDHRDTDPSNNRWINLRPALPMENSHNRGMSANNTSGFKGIYVSPNKDGRWGAQICVAHQKHFLGYHDTPEAAHLAYCEAARRLHGEFAHVG